MDYFSFCEEVGTYCLCFMLSRSFSIWIFWGPSQFTCLCSYCTFWGVCFCQEYVNWDGGVCCQRKVVLCIVLCSLHVQLFTFSCDKWNTDSLTSAAIYLLMHQLLPVSVESFFGWLMMMMLMMSAKAANGRQQDWIKQGPRKQMLRICDYLRQNWLVIRWRQSWKSFLQ